MRTEPLFRLSTLLFFFLALLCSTTRADISIDTSIIYFEPGQPNRIDVEVENVSDEPAYVRVEPTVVMKPGTEQQIRQTYTNPKEAGLLVSPNKLVIPPHGRKLVRFVNLRPNDKQERVYRVKIAPVVGDLVADQSGIKILIGYEVLVLAHPNRKEPNLVASREGKKLTLKNEGNTNVLVREIVQCANESKNDETCDHLSGKRLYPGNQLEVHLPNDLPVKLHTSTGLDNAVQLVK